jgi:hypothetical protein
VWASVSTLGLTCTKVSEKMLQRERKSAILCPRDSYMSLTVLMIIIEIFVLPSHNVKTDKLILNCVFGVPAQISQTYIIG